MLALAGGVQVAALVAGLGSRQAPVAPDPDRGTGKRLPDLPLVTHDGRRVSFYSDLIRNRIVLVNMMYAQCGNRCPPMTQSLRAVQDALGPRVGRDIFMYSITLLPEVDGPAELRAYMDLHGVRSGWTYLTGAKSDIERLRRALGLFDPDPGIDNDIGQHVGMVCIGNDALDRWCMTPITGAPHLILEALTGVDPVSRPRTRAHVML